MPGDERTKLGEVEFADVKRVLNLNARSQPQIGVKITIGRRHDQHAVGSQHSLDLGKHAVVIGEVLEGFKAHNHLHRIIVKWHGLAAPDKEADLITRVVLPSVLHGLLAHVNTDYFGGDTRKQGRSIAFAGCDIENSFAPA